MEAMSTLDRPDIESMSGDAVDVVPIDRDWSQGYGETWEYYEAPSCPQCGNYARWTDNRGEDYHAWRCVEESCEQDEVDPYDGGAEGPMMNYAYRLPTHGDDQGYDQSDADVIRDLPLCIVWTEAEGYFLALTGGGMDLSWEICEAYMRLGFIPPLHFANLPRMAGRGDAPTPSDAYPNSDNYMAWERKRSARDAWIIAACRMSAEVAIRRAQSTMDRLAEFTATDEAGR